MWREKQYLGHLQAELDLMLAALRNQIFPRMVELRPLQGSQFSEFICSQLQGSKRMHLHEGLLLEVTETLFQALWRTGQFYEGCAAWMVEMTIGLPAVMDSNLLMCRV
jgi:hypothetical protein